MYPNQPAVSAIDADSAGSFGGNVSDPNRPTEGDHQP
jgi:hypothetical protein